MAIVLHKNIERCDCDVIHESTVRRVKEKMPKEETLYNVAELFKIFGDSTRIKMLWALRDTELCVCDIAFLLDMTQSAISHQLRLLKHSDLVKSRRDGRIIFYSLKDERVKQLLDLAV